ncbi:MAG: hypothetical protein HY301_04135 [Verrucomicrobia bacterium]|nr:hypothetical protein [Verrucomicrobiota bacterium]
MKHTSILLSLAAVVCSLFTATHCARAQSTAFTYQGFLTSQGAPANGSFDLQFAVFDAVSGGAQQGVTVVSNSFGVTNGLFTVTVDPGANVFTGAARWLNVAVRPAGSATFTNVVPRQSVTAAPYAITAGTVTGPINGASIAAGTVTSTQLAAGAVTAANIASNSITANQLAAGAAVSNLNASGQTGVASGGMILSASDTNAALANAGYVKIGVTTTSDSWLQRTTVPSPVSRYSHTAVWTGGEVIVWGGFNGSAYLNDGGRYNPAADTWTPVTTVGAPSVRDSHTAVWTGSEMIVWGGETNTPGVFNDGGRYSPAADTWTAVTTNGAPSARGSHTAVWTGIEMIVWGGISNATYSTDGGRFNPASNSWTAVSTTNAPSVRRFHTAVWTGNEMVVWGGNHGGPNNNNSTTVGRR